MARIRFYPEDNNLHPSDHIIGTDEVGAGGATRVFTLEALTDYITTAIGTTLPKAIGNGFVPSGDGLGVWNQSPIKIEGEAGSNILPFQGLSGEVKLFRDSLGASKLSITIEVPGGFSTPPEELVGATFSAASATAVTGTVGAYGGYVTSGTELVFLYDIKTDVTLPVFPETNQPTSISFENVTFFTRNTTYISGNTVNVGDLEVKGILTTNGTEIDLSQVTSNSTDIDTLQNTVDSLSVSKANTTDLHPAVTVPIPSPEVSGTAKTAIVSINVDPVTQELSVVRGTVPVVIGGGGSDSGSTETISNISINGFSDIERATFQSSSNISWITSSAPGSVTLTPQLNTTGLLNDVNSRIDTLESTTLSGLDVGSISDVDKITLGVGLKSSGNASNLSITSVGTAEYIDLDGQAINPFDPASNIITGILSENELRWLPVDATTGVEAGLWRYSTDSDQSNDDTTHNWTRIASLPEAGSLCVPYMTKEDSPVMDKCTIHYVDNSDSDANRGLILPSVGIGNGDWVRVVSRVTSGTNVTVDVADGSGHYLEGNDTDTTLELPLANTNIEMVYINSTMGWIITTS